MEAPVYILLIILSVIDYGVGSLAHTLAEGFQSSKMREGLVHKFTYLVVIIVCVIVTQLGKFLDLPYIYGTALEVLAATWIAVTEIGSILENLVLLNPELGDKTFLRIFDKRAKDDTAKTAEPPIPDEEDNLCRR